MNQLNANGRAASSFAAVGCLQWGVAAGAINSSLYGRGLNVWNILPLGNAIDKILLPSLAQSRSRQSLFGLPA